MNIFLLVAAIVILFMGRQIFWLFVAAIGAVAGGQLGLQYGGVAHTGLAQFGLMLLGALLGASIAIFFQPFAAMMAGFYAGSFVFQDLALRLGLVHADGSWLPFVVGGVIGAVLMLLIFNWALIILSSLYGATLIIQNAHFDHSQYVFLGLFLVGVIVQAGLFRRSRGLL